MSMENEFDIELSDEAKEQLVKLALELREKINVLYDVLVEIVQKCLEVARAFAEQLGRFFLKMQLLEWRVPMPVADFISQKIYWFWAFKLGFNWFERRMAMIE